MEKDERPYCSTCGYGHCPGCGKIIEHHALCPLTKYNQDLQRQDGETWPPPMCTTCHRTLSLGGHKPDCSVKGDDVSRKHPQVGRDHTVTETGKDGRPRQWEKKDGHWSEKTPDLCTSCQAVLPHHAHTCGKCTTITVDGRLYTKGVRCKTCSEPDGWHKASCHKEELITDTKPITTGDTFTATVCTCKASGTVHYQTCPKYTAPNVVSLTKTTGTGTGYYGTAPTCWHDGDEVIYNIGDLEFIICDSKGSDPWKADVVLDLAGNLSFGKAKFVATDGKWGRLNKHVKTADVVRLNWPDYDIAPVPLEFWKDLLTELPRSGKVMITCVGGHGRSGTCLAAIMVANGVLSTDAIEIVRARHCRKAIETSMQERYILYLGEQAGEKEIKDEAVDPRETGEVFEYCSFCGRDFEKPAATDICMDCAPNLRNDGYPSKEAGVVAGNYGAGWEEDDTYMGPADGRDYVASQAGSLALLKDVDYSKPLFGDGE